jgi:hypothetical protein
MITEKITKNTKIIMIPNLLGGKIDWMELRFKLKDMGREGRKVYKTYCEFRHCKFRHCIGERGYKS